MTELKISDSEFALFRDLMRRVAGVELTAGKKHLVSGRLARRLRERRVASFSEYYTLVCATQEAEEFQRMLDLLTTHETYFFREPRHFEYLAATVLPQYAAGRALRVWSAASSSGEEAYSIAMVLMDRLGAAHPWQVFASDISRDVLARARLGIYDTARVSGLPPAYLRRYCLRGVGSQSSNLRVAPEIRERVTFAQVNLNASLAEQGEFDIIFLRNVLIYFDMVTKQQIVARIAGQLRRGGRLFIGHSESLTGIADGLELDVPTIYRRC